MTKLFGYNSQHECQTTQQVLVRKSVQKFKFEAAEMILDPLRDNVHSHLPHAKRPMAVKGGGGGGGV